MPHYHLHVTSSDGAIESPDPEGFTIGDIGAARALAVETLVASTREAASDGKPRTITVTLENDRGGIVYRDFASVSASNPDDAALGRAIGAMRRVR